MNYKEAFYVLLVIFLLSLGIGTYVIYDIHNTLDTIDEYILDDKITKYHDAGWLPYDHTKKLKKYKKGK